MKLFLYIVQCLGQRLREGKVWLGCLAILPFFYSPVIALPRFTVNSNYWQEKTRIFLANCPEQACLGDNIRALKPNTRWMPKSQILDLTWVGSAKMICPRTDKTCLAFYHKMASRKSVIYGVSATENSPSVVYQFDAESGEELASVSLQASFTVGFLLAEEVYFERV